MTGDRPLCTCHGEPQYRNAKRWECAPKRRQREMERYWSLSGVEFSALLMRKRREAALRRMAERKAS